MRFNFVVGRSEAEIARLVQCYEDIATAVASTDIFSNGELCWGLQTFALLARRGRLDVTCTNRLDPAAINLVHSDTLLGLRPDFRTFVACIRADYPKREWANYHIVQNRDQEGPRSGYLPLWVQAGIKRRDAGRRGVSAVAYFGQVNRNLAGAVDGWRSLFAAHGIEFEVPSREQWHDMSQTDVLIGIRSFDRNPHSTKPPSKLLNAWHARAPFIGGYDSAYRQVGTPERDYLIAATPCEALDQVMRLAHDPDLYARLVRNGETMACQYTSEAIAAKWESLLEGDVMQCHAQWQRSTMAPVTYAFDLATGLALHHVRHLGRRTLGVLARAHKAGNMSQQ